MHGTKNTPAIVVHLFLLVHLSQIVLISGILFEYQRRCPDNQQDWEARSNSYICGGDTVYHCMQDQEGRYVTFCESNIWIQPDYCPEFNSKVSAIDVILCPGALAGCPEAVYLSNANYKYPSCFRTVTRPTTKTTTTEAINTTSSISWSKPPAEEEQNVKPWLPTLSIALGIILPVFVITFLVLLFRARRNSMKSKPINRYTEETEEGTWFLMDVGNTTTAETNADMEGNTVIHPENVSEDNLKKDVKSNEKFIEPKTYSEAVEKVKTEGYVILYGATGCGKSTVATHLVRNEFPDYKVVHLRGKQKNAPRFSSDGGLVFWDDCFGIWKIKDDENKDDTSKYMKTLIDKCKRDPQKYKAVLCFDSFFKYEQNNPCDNITDGMTLDKNYDSQTKKENFRDEMKPTKYFTIPNVCNEVGFPLLINLILRDPFLQENTNAFFKDPTSVLQDRFLQLLKDHVDVYVTLIYAVCNSPVDLKDVSKEKWDILKKECEDPKSRESGKEKEDRKGYYTSDAKENTENKTNSKTSDEATIPTPTTSEHSEMSKEPENSALHGETMDSGYNKTNNVNVGTDVCDRNGESAGGNYVDDNAEKNRNEVEDDARSRTSDKLNARGTDGNSGDEMNRSEVARSCNKLNVKNSGIFKNRNVIEMNETLAKYLVESEMDDKRFEFRHQFLAETLLRFHIKNVGKKGVSKVAKKEVAFVLEKLSKCNYDR
ncbi:uncharacterized protein LOC125664550 [Ostrea edulis]|uniref:uncharacterized protein LOC125664550 n=1 Tax=Ostrea edulis TaxID=37623 RepID=UPI0024B000DF|nr:uncharacterized protein LOC125664550 [Ostrea edulis]